MKSIIYQLFALFFVLFISISNPIFSQKNCTIELSASVQHCTCINNGEIKFKLTKSINCDIDTNNIRFSLFSNDNSISSINNISPVFNNLPPGDYLGIVSALNHTGEMGSEANIILHDSLNITLSTIYIEPSLALLENEYTHTSPFGKVRSLPCVPTGIVQLQINGGSFPYYVDVYQYDGSNYQFHKNVVFDSIQQSGNEPNKMDYREYYNIDSLPAGKYRFRFRDGCGYELPAIETTLKETPLLHQTTPINTKGKNRDSQATNEIYAIEFSWPEYCPFTQYADYYAERQNNNLETYWEYRWIDPSIDGHPADTSSWQAVRFKTIYHTVNNASRYCDIWGKNLLLQIRDVSCLSNITYTYKIEAPYRVFDQHTSLQELEGTTHSYTDSCGLYQISVNKAMYYYSFTAENEFNKLFTVMEGGKRKINFTITDATMDTLIHQEIPSTVSGNPFSYQTNFSFDNAYHGKVAKIRIADALSCPIFEENITIVAQELNTFTRPSISISEKKESESSCQASTVELHITNSIHFSDRDSLQITESADEMNNCTAYYDESTGQWVRCDSNATISLTGSSTQVIIKHIIKGHHVTIRYTSGCITQEQVYNFASPSLFFEPTPMSFKVEPTCTGSRIIPLSGNYILYHYPFGNNRRQGSAEAYFRVYGNPSSPNSVTGYYQLGDTINISAEGNIRVEMCLSPGIVPSYICLYRDTVFNIQKRPLQYDYFYSYCCNIGDTISTVRTRAKGGTPPYLYIITDKYGRTLDSNNVGDIFNVPLPHHDTVSLRVYDNCGSNFTYKGQVIEQQQIKKAWFTDGGQHFTQEDSSICQMFAISLDDIDYHWSGPKGFVSDKRNPSFFIPTDSNLSGKYYLSIRDSVCGILQDSLELKVLNKRHIPELLWINDSICSGKSYDKHGFFISSSPTDTLCILYDTLISAMEDSIFLQLNILPVYKPTHIDSITTTLDQYLYGDKLLIDTGLHTITFKSECNCDSIVHVYLMFSKYLPCPEAIDYDGNHYSTARINNHCWITENLKSTHYSDGRPVAQLYEYIAYEFPDKAANVAIFGLLYDWFAATDSGKHSLPDPHGNIQGICPEGWLLPTPEDFTELNCYTVKQLRSPLYWLNNPGTNESGFSSLPAGYYDALRQRYSNLLGNAYYWSYSPPEFPILIFKIYSECQILQQTENVSNAYSVRCIQK